MIKDMSLSKRIYELRKSNGMSQEDLAEKINLTEQHISHIENGYTKLSLPALVAIANALSVDCNTLLGTTLTGAQKEIMNQELKKLTSEMDAKKLRFCVEFCRLLKDYDSIEKG